jgi:GMP synthase (glutamine-hydrolysing)
MSHGDQVKKIPRGFKTTGFSDICQNAIMVNEHKQFYGIQFHPEVQHTINGSQILKNFVFNIAKAKAN